MPPRSWVKAAFDVFDALVDSSRDARLVLAHLVRRMSMDTPYVSVSCVEIAAALELSKPRVSKAAKELGALGLARYTVRGKRWEIEPALVQFGNVLRDPEFAAFMEAQRAESEVPFPPDNARDVRHEPVVIEEPRACIDEADRAKKEAGT
ncbi:hypothetical protein [Ruegeria sp. HKCCD6428]|uniref:hypothetical protein n=1 Tax=Ruegeria sp. HKCCD6428 TaxID=2683002 RepID=UPI001490F994|nr:hypothetical protein [Ruegeria sp. HKCCD6428]NOC83335.1 hypothetical protein [Ruegeria sp. HKCCD6428]